MIEPTADRMRVLRVSLLPGYEETNWSVSRGNLRLFTGISQGFATTAGGVAVS